MFNSEEINKIQEVIEEFFKKMGFKLRVLPKLVSEENTEDLIVQLSTSDTRESALLIGRAGTHLRSLHYFLRLFVSSKIGERPYCTRFILDVNNYLENHKSYLQKLALDAARQAIKLQKEIVLEPMNAFDRRIIHLFLAGSKKVCTESQGEEPRRRIVVKPL